MTQNRIVPWIIWMITLGFCLYQFVLRVFPGNVQSELMSEFQIDATAFGLFSAAYYIGYAGFQIPLAILMEKFGPRKIVTLAAFICAIGCWIMVSTDSWNMAIISRFMIGVGSVVGFLGTTKVIIDWFDVKNQTKMIGLSMSIGLLGALYGGKPIRMLVEEFHWEWVLLSLGLVSAAIAVIALIMIPKTRKCPADPIIMAQQPPSSTPNSESLLRQIIPLFKNRTFIILIIANFLMVGCLEGFADVWGPKYLSIAMDMNKSEASLITSFIFLGMIIGAPLLSLIADKTGKHIILTGLCGVAMAVSLGTLLLWPEWFSLVGLKLLMLCIGVFSGYQALAFAIGKDLVSRSLGNIVISVLNCINMFGGSFFHSTIGIMMDICYDGQIDSLGIPIYDLKTTSIGLMVIPIMSLVGGLMLLTVHRLKKFLSAKSMANMLTHE